jgi:hypothetical protein
MKVKYAIILLAISFILLCCKKDNILDSNPGSPPIVSIISPTADVTYNAFDDSINVTIGVTSENSISKVTLFIDSLDVHEFSTTPYSYMWKIASITGNGQHTIFASAQTQKGAIGTSPAITIGIYDPNPTASLNFYPALSTSPTDSLFLPLTAANSVYNSFIKKVQIYVDNILVREYFPPPLGIYWTFTDLQNNSIHSVYAKAYDWRNRSGTTASTNITLHITPHSTYSPILTIGNRWYYHYSDGNVQANVVREIVDTSSDGWRGVNVTKDGLLIDKEYWFHSNGDFYIYIDNGGYYFAGKYQSPIYIASLTKDSSANYWPGSYNYTWSKQNYFFLNSSYSIQKTDMTYFGGCTIPCGHGWTFKFSKEIGLAYVYYSGFSIMKNENDTCSIRAVYLNGVLIGDSTYSIH